MAKEPAQQVIEDRKRFVDEVIAETNYGKNFFRLDKVLQWYMHFAGGEKAFAKAMHEAYTAAPAGGLAQQRILDLLTTLARFVESRMPPEPEMANLTLADLRREAAMLIGELEKSNVEIGKEQGKKRSAGAGVLQPRAEEDGTEGGGSSGGTADGATSAG